MPMFRRNIDIKIIIFLKIQPISRYNTCNASVRRMTIMAASSRTAVGESGATIEDKRHACVVMATSKRILRCDVGLEEGEYK